MSILDKQLLAVRLIIIKDLNSMKKTKQTVKILNQDAKRQMKKTQEKSKRRTKRFYKEKEKAAE